MRRILLGLVVAPVWVVAMTWTPFAVAEDCESLRRLIEARIEATRGTEGTDDPQIRETLGKIMNMRRGERARAAAAALASPDAGIRHAAATALGHVGGEAARTFLVAALADPEPFVVSEALEGLARGGPEAVVEHARTLARDPRDIVRSAAARILLRLDPEFQAAVPPAEATEVHALRILDAARRGDAGRIRSALHPIRRIEVVEEREVQGFLLASATPVVISRQVLPPLRRAQQTVDSLRCGPPDPQGGAVCVVTDRVGYSTELHFARLLDRLYLYRVRHHGGVPEI